MKNGNFLFYASSFIAFFLCVGFMDYERTGFLRITVISFQFVVFLLILFFNFWRKIWTRGG